MTPVEARMIAAVASTADGGCTTCAMGLADELSRLFPGFDWESLVLGMLNDKNEQGSTLGWAKVVRGDDSWWEPPDGKGQ